jgi:AraC-like DNA-binding protein
MHQGLYEPDPALKGFVNNIMVHELKVDAAHIRHTFPIPPLPEQCIFFYLRDRGDSENISSRQKEKTPSVMVVGPSIHRHNFTPGHDHLMIKVGFQPGGLYRLTGIPMTSLLCSDSFNGPDLLGIDIWEVYQQLQETDSISNMKLIVENYLLKQVNKLKPVLPIDHVFTRLIKERGMVKIDKLVSEACLSVRQFERVFQQRIGLTPKFFARLVRFNQAWIIKEQQPGVSWIRIAHECGYFDQMHLIRDFQEFTGANPSSIESELLTSQAKFFVRLFH